MGSGRGWLAVDGGVLNITAAACTAGFHWWRSGNIPRTQNVSEYMLILALCLVICAVAAAENDDVTTVRRRRGDVTRRGAAGRRAPPGAGGSH